MTVDMSPEAVSRRLEALSRLADLGPGRRLAGKVDMSPGAVTRRLELQARLRAACLAWGRAGRRGRGDP